VLKKHRQVKSAVEQLINTLAVTFTAKMSKAEKLNAVRWHAEYMIESLNALLSQGTKSEPLKRSDVAMTVKLIMASFDAALRSRVNNFISRDKTGRAYTLQNMLERQILLAALDNEALTLINRAFEINFKEVQWVERGIVTDIDFSNTTSTRAAYNKIFKIVPRNPYSTGVFKF
jgi:hypothetical protein